MEQHLDIVDRVLETIEGLNTGMKVLLGVNDDTDSIAVLHTGGGGIKEYYDDIVEKEFPLILQVKGQRQDKVLNNCLRLTRHFNELHVLDSRNGTYEFVSSTVTEAPMLLGITEQNEHIYSLQIVIKIEMRKGMMING